MRRSHVLASCLATGALAVAATPSAAAPVVLLNDQFTDADRTNQALPDSAQWFVASSHGPTRAGFAAAGGALSLPQSNGGTATSEIAYFTPSGSPQALAVGDSLSLTFQLKFDALPASDRGFRVGFFDSNASRLTADSTNQATLETNPSEGYTFDINPTGFATQITERRDSTSPTSTPAVIFGGTTSPLGSGTASGGSTIAAGAAFPVSFTLTRTAGGLGLTGTFNGNTFSATDNNAGGDGTLFNTFDTVAFFQTTAVVAAGTNVANTITFDDVNVTFTPVPEPTGLAAAGLAGAGLLARGRRRGSFASK